MPLSYQGKFMPKHVQESMDFDRAFDAYISQAKTVRARTAKPAAFYTAAAGAALALAPSADAAMQWSGRLDIALPTVGSTALVNINAATLFTHSLADGIDDFSFKLFSGYSASIGRGLNFQGAGWVNYLGFPARLNAGEIISSTSVGGQILRFASGGSTSGNWLGGTMNFDAAHFLGVGFNFITGATTNLHYAWVRVGIDTNASGSPIAMTVYDWAWEDQPNLPVMAGSLNSIPEPSPASGLALLAAGAAGVTAWRRRKQSKTTS